MRKAADLPRYSRRVNTIQHSVIWSEMMFVVELELWYCSYERRTTVVSSCHMTSSLSQCLMISPSCAVSHDHWAGLPVTILVRALSELNSSRTHARPHTQMTEFKVAGAQPAHAQYTRCSDLLSYAAK